MKTQKLLTKFGESDCAGYVTQTIHALESEDGQALSTIWYHMKGYVTLEITGMFTLPRLRRNGIATWLFKQLLAGYPQIDRVVTASGTKYSRPWLLKHGFVRQNMGDWVLNLKMKGN